jgi:hypothetical protein
MADNNLTKDGERILERWSTTEEKEFLQQLAAGHAFCRSAQVVALRVVTTRPIEKLRNYLDWAAQYRTDWEGLDKPEVMACATKLYWQLVEKEGEVAQQLIEVELLNEDHDSETNV